MLKVIRNLFNGLVFGIIEIVPGISSITIAMVMGFYFELIGAINNFTKDTKKSLKFLIPLVIGMITSVPVLDFMYFLPREAVLVYVVPLALTLGAFIGLFGSIISIRQYLKV